MKGSELYVEIEGKKFDAHLHEALLDNPRAGVYSDISAIQRFIDRGGSLSDAVERLASPETVEYLKKNKFI